jgi:hypothetical protein
VGGAGIGDEKAGDAHGVVFPKDEDGTVNHTVLRLN